MRSHITPAACAGIMGSLFGHHYEARYSTVERAITDALTLTAIIGITDDRPVERDRTYHGDVCTRCGDQRPAIREPDNG